MWNGEEQIANGHSGSGAASDAAADSKNSRGRQSGRGQIRVASCTRSRPKPLASRQVIDIPSSSGLRQPETLRHHPLAAAANPRPRGRVCAKEFSGLIDHIINQCNRSMFEVWCMQTRGLQICGTHDKLLVQLIAPAESSRGYS